MPRIPSSVLALYTPVKGDLCYYCLDSDVSRKDFIPPVKYILSENVPQAKQVPCCQKCYSKIYYESLKRGYLDEVAKLELLRSTEDADPKLTLAKTSLPDGSWIVIPTGMVRNESDLWMSPKFAGYMFSTMELTHLQSYFAMKYVGVSADHLDITLRLLASLFNLPKPIEVYQIFAEALL